MLKKTALLLMAFVFIAMVNCSGQAQTSSLVSSTISADNTNFTDAFEVAPIINLDELAGTADETMNYKTEKMTEKYETLHNKEFHTIDFIDSETLLCTVKDNESELSDIGSLCLLNLKTGKLTRLEKGKNVSFGEKEITINEANLYDIDVIASNHFYLTTTTGYGFSLEVKDDRIVDFHDFSGLMTYYNEGYSICAYNPISKQFALVKDRKIYIADKDFANMKCISENAVSTNVAWINLNILLSSDHQNFDAPSYKPTDVAVYGNFLTKHFIDSQQTVVNDSGYIQKTDEAENQEDNSYEFAILQRYQDFCALYNPDAKLFGIINIKQNKYYRFYSISPYSPRIRAFPSGAYIAYFSGDKDLSWYLYNTVTGEFTKRCSLQVKETNKNDPVVDAGIVSPDGKTLVFIKSMGEGVYINSKS